jgi:hypothetical protein
MYQTKVIGNIDFFSHNEASVVAKTNASQENQESAYLLLFAWFSLRILSLIHGDYRQILIKNLYEIGEGMQPNKKIKDYGVNIVEITEQKEKKGFSFRLDIGNAGYKPHNKPYGFGLLGRGTNYYAPMAVLILAAHLVDCNKDNQKFIKAIKSASKRIALWALDNKVSIKDEQVIGIMLSREYDQ